MPFTRFTAQRGGTVTLEAIFRKDGELEDPYSQTNMYVDLYQSDMTTFISGLYLGSPTNIHMSGLSVTRGSQGYYFYDFLTLSGLDVGTYIDVWRNIQYIESSPVTSGIFAFNIFYNTEDLSDWDVLPG